MATEELQEIVRKAVYRLGLAPVAQCLGVTKESVARLALGLDVRANTRTVAELRAPLLEGATK
jgi:hypothetical protein